MEWGNTRIHGAICANWNLQGSGCSIAMDERRNRLYNGHRNPACQHATVPLKQSRPAEFLFCLQSGHKLITWDNLIREYFQRCVLVDRTIADFLCKEICNLQMNAFLGIFSLWEALCSITTRVRSATRFKSTWKVWKNIWMRRIVWKKFVLAYVHNGLHTFLLLCCRKLANGSGGKCDTQLQMQRFVSLAEVRLKREVKKVIGVKNPNTKKYNKKQRNRNSDAKIWHRLFISPCSTTLQDPRPLALWPALTSLVALATGYTWS